MKKTKIRIWVDRGKDEEFVSFVVDDELKEFEIIKSINEYLLDNSGLDEYLDDLDDYLANIDYVYKYEYI